MHGISKGRKPVAAALTGTAVGIGFELPLACHRIICADNPDARFGLPEIKVGLFPGAGGTTRLVRRLGLAAAGPWLFRGTLADPGKALSAGLVGRGGRTGEACWSARGNGFWRHRTMTLSSRGIARDSEFRAERPMTGRVLTVSSARRSWSIQVRSGSTRRQRPVFRQSMEGSLVPFDLACKRRGALVHRSSHGAFDRLHDPDRLHGQEGAGQGNSPSCRRRKHRGLGGSVWSAPE